MTVRTPGPALAGLRVLDLSRVLAGPWATQALADLGAEVIKIERPHDGDETRAWGPPWLKDGHGRDTGESAYFLAANRNKKSVTLDLAHPAGQAIARELAATCDIVVENFKVGGLQQYGLDYETLTALNPRLIYCSITGFGQTGPLAARSGYDFMIQGMSGLMSVTGAAADVPCSEPQKVGVALVDVLTGLYAATGILAAVEQRHRTGLGQHIDLALFDCAVAALANQALSFLVSGAAPGRMGNAHPSIVPYQVFATADGHLILAVGNDAQFARFCTVAGADHLSSDPRFTTNAARVANRADLVPTIAQLMRQQTTTTWIGRLEAAGVPCGPINDIAQALGEPQAKARGLTLSLPHSAGVLAPGIRNPLHMAGHVAEDATAPPALGQHTDTVLRDWLGKTDADVRALRQAKVI